MNKMNTVENNRVMVAMSGGVDSSVTGLILKQQGYQVIGGTMEIFPDYEQPSAEEGGCCSLSAIEDARQIAASLDIPHYTFNLKDIFHNKVIDNFVSEYSRGRTPNPCVICNNEIKFKVLLRKARQIDCDFLATGHYSRIKRVNNRYLLKRGKDKNKDQSYMLYGLTQNQLKHTLFPLGNYQKTEVRKKAQKAGFRIYNKSDSQEICFVVDNDYTRFLDENYPRITRKGPILDFKGNQLGEHQGLHHYTVGQRRGLGISRPYPLYVIELDYENNAVIVGKAEHLYSKGLIAGHVNWIVFDNLDKSREVTCKIRYNSPGKPATISPLPDNKVKVIFTKKQRAVTPGQSVVFYQGDLVVGGGLIEKNIERV